MVAAKTRARNILRALPLSQRDRALYERGVAAMDEATLERTTSRLEAALAKAPETLAAARELLAAQRAQSRKRAVLLVADDDYRDLLSEKLGEVLDVEISEAPEDAIQTISQTFPDVVICDFKMPHAESVDILRRMRRAAASPCAIFVRTNSPEEDGQVAAVGASCYPASKTATDLTRAVASAIEASAWRANKA